MDTQKFSAPHQWEYLNLISKQFPTIQSVSSEIINLNAILSLPKGTEHFMSDLHGEDAAFLHIVNNCSGVIRGYIDDLFSLAVPERERAAIATLVYYPARKLEFVKRSGVDMDEWYKTTLVRLIELCRQLSSKYTRSKVRKAMTPNFSYIIDELLHTDRVQEDKREYFTSIVMTIIKTGRADDFISAISSLIKRLAVDRLHIIGDIYDRGPGAQRIIDVLMQHHSVDIQWGNHDVLWMGAAAGSEACIAAVLNNALQYTNTETLENGYGISLLSLAEFADSTYEADEVFTPKRVDLGDIGLTDPDLLVKMKKAMAVMMLKLEGQVIMRRPDFDMDDRLLLHKMDLKAGTVEIGGETYKLRDSDFPTIDANDPYALSPDERLVMDRLREAFLRGDKLQRHIRFLFTKGSIYKVANNNLLVHACVPMDADGNFIEMSFGGRKYSGRALLDYCEHIARDGYFAKQDSEERLYGGDFLWWLWCGRNSPVYGRERMTTFERLLIDDKKTHDEPKNSYFERCDRAEDCIKVLAEFGISPEGHIINGHIPVKQKDGESPVKANGRRISIDGGFSRAYQQTTGIAGYTLIYNSRGLRLVSHQPFETIDKAVLEDSDIYSSYKMLELAPNRMRVANTDIGDELRQQLSVLSALLEAYLENDIPQRSV